MVTVSLSELIGVGLYTVPQAARLTGVPSASIKRWMFGYQYQYKDQQRTQECVVHPQLADLQAQAKLISFSDLIEVMFVHEFRRQGVSWKIIRHAAEKARDLVRDDHPFSSQRFLTDGHAIFADIAVKARTKSLVNLVNDQLLFRSMMLPELRGSLEFKGKAIARWWPMGKRKPVLLDPDRQFGQPITEEEGVPTQVLAKAYESLGSEEKVARWYDVSKRSVKASIEFERRAA